MGNERVMSMKRLGLSNQQGIHATDDMVDLEEHSITPIEQGTNKYITDKGVGS
jgi:hypothetical protein